MSTTSQDLKAISDIAKQVDPLDEKEEIKPAAASVSTIDTVVTEPVDLEAQNEKPKPKEKHWCRRPIKMCWGLETNCWRLTFLAAFFSAIIIALICVACYANHRNQEDFAQQEDLHNQ